MFLWFLKYTFSAVILRLNFLKYELTCYTLKKRLLEPGALKDKQFWKNCRNCNFFLYISYNANFFFKWGGYKTNFRI